jgi:hypothetical protein
MTSEEFVEAIRLYVMDAAVTNEIANLEDPPGRQPAPTLLQQSRWFKNLGDSDRAMVASLLASAAEAAVFGFLNVLDGSRTIAGPMDYFELRHVHEDGVDVLSGPHGAILHELL